MNVRCALHDLFRYCRRGALFLMVGGLLCAGCASNSTVYVRPGEQEPRALPDAVAASTTSADQRAQEKDGSNSANSDGLRAAMIAVSMIGVPYRYGGATPQGFDCSGLVQYAYSRVGIDVPRTTEQQQDASTPIHWRDAQAGDLLFFSTSRKVSHVAIYLDDGRFVHAPSTGKSVELASLDNAYYRDHLVHAGRLVDLAIR